MIIVAERSFDMKAKRNLCFLLFLVFSIIGCANFAERKIVENPTFKGPFKFGTVDILGMETAPYLMNSIMTKVETYLRQEGLLYDEKIKGPFYTVDMLIKAEYPAFRKSENMSSYTNLETKVVLRDPDGRVMKEGVIGSVNGFREMLSDFTELEHAKEIVRFITTK